MEINRRAGIQIIVDLLILSRLHEHPCVSLRNQGEGVKTTKARLTESYVGGIHVVSSRRRANGLQLLQDKALPRRDSKANVATNGAVASRREALTTELLDGRTGGEIYVSVRHGIGRGIRDLYERGDEAVSRLWSDCYCQNSRQRP